jgi:hypothetical protein
MRLLVSGCKERNRVHLNMMLVHDRSHENAFIDLLEVGIGWSTPDPGPFFGWMAFQKFPLVGLELGGEKKFKEKKVRKQVGAKGPGLWSLATQPLPFDF